MRGQLENEQQEKPVLLPGSFVGTNSGLLSTSVGCSALESALLRMNVQNAPLRS